MATAPRPALRAAFVVALAGIPVGPLLGSLSTALAMQKTFASVSAAAPAEKATLLADGIAAAMTGTTIGLVVGAVAAVVAAGFGLLLWRGR